MAAMFERAVSNFPEMEPEMINLDPPVLVFDKFVTDDEVRTAVPSPRPRTGRARPHPSLAPTSPQPQPQPRP